MHIMTSANVLANQIDINRSMNNINQLRRYDTTEMIFFCITDLHKCYVIKCTIN